MGYTILRSAPADTNPVLEGQYLVIKAIRFFFRYFLDRKKVEHAVTNRMKKEADLCVQILLLMMRNLKRKKHLAIFDFGNPKRGKMSIKMP
jgi:hypothetical protein